MIYVRKVVLLVFALTLLNLLSMTQPDSVFSQAEEQEVSLSGWFTIIWGDSRDGQDTTVYMLTGEDQKQTQLLLDKETAKKLGGVLRFNRKHVTVHGVVATPPQDIDKRPVDAQGVQDVPGSAAPATQGVIDVLTITATETPHSMAPAAPKTPSASAVSGSNPWVTIMCKFTDHSTVEPNDVAFFQDMYDDAAAGLNVYWKELSYNTANIDGSTVGGHGWYDLPEDVEHYNPGWVEKGTDRSALANDCIAAVDADVDFSPYVGINMMFNFDFDNGWAWGGSRTLTLDGETRVWSITWEPPWSYSDISVISHEMGHGFGLPHSSFIRADVYDNPWDVMSQDRYNCGAATDPVYGCMAQHTISHHKDLLGWIPAARQTTVNTGSVGTYNLADLASPASSDYQIIKVPIVGSATNFYTFEARRFTGFDGKLPDQAVIIHNVDTTEDIPAVLVPDAANRENGWTVGEVFTDAVNDITMSVNSDTGSGFEITVTNAGNLPPIADAGGPYSEECEGNTTSVTLDGSGSVDPEGSSLTYAWDTTCDGTFNNSTLMQPVLTITTTDTCESSCSVSLTVTDSEGLPSSSSSSIVTITDTTPPMLSGVPDDTLVECSSVPPPAAVTAEDICNSDVTLSYEEVKSEGSCEDSYSLARSWTTSDSCDNEAGDEQIVTVVDTTAPVLACPADMTIECDESSDPSNTGEATAADNCDATPDINFSDSVAQGECAAEKVITRTWTSDDNCSNTSTCVQTIEVVDTTQPVITCNAPPTISPNNVPLTFTATAEDNCDEDPVVEILGYSCFKYTKKGKIINKEQSCQVEVAEDKVFINDSGGVGDNITWMVQATDCSGNTAVQECLLQVINPND